MRNKIIDRRTRYGREIGGTETREGDVIMMNETRRGRRARRGSIALDDVTTAPPFYYVILMIVQLTYSGGSTLF